MLETNISHLLSIPSWSCSHPDGCEGLLGTTHLLLLPSAEGWAPSNGIPELGQVPATGSSHPGTATRAGFCSAPWSSQTVQLEISSSIKAIDQQGMHRLLESEGRCSVGLKHSWIASMLPLKPAGAGLL